MNIDVTKQYALAVSGGIDSMVMLHKFATLLPRPSFYVVTINHSIRKQAQADCNFVAACCKRMGIDCKIFKIDVPAFSKQNKISQETAARILRYDVLDGLPCDYVCLAHHADDNAETVLMHIMRGSGALGAEGIRRENGKYLRPLLNMTRAEICQYASQNGIEFVRDETNADDSYTRNFVRHNIIPQMEKAVQGACTNICRFAQNIAEDNAYLDSVADISSVHFSDNSATIPCSLLALPKPVSYRILRKVFAAMGIYYDIEKKHYDALIELSSNNGGKMLSLPFDLTAVNDYNYITLMQNAKSALESFCIPFATGNTSTPLGTVQISSKKSDGCLQFDIARIPQTAVFRTIKDGDVFTKFGGGTKPLRRYFIDKKIPQRNRNNLLLVADGNDVLIICNVEISDKVKTDNNSDKYYIKLTGENTTDGAHKPN